MTNESASLNSSSMHEDQAVIKKIMDGDVDDFEVLLRKYSPKMFAMIGRKVPREDVASVAQEVFLSAFRSLGTYEAMQPFEHWMARIARRRCCDYWRERERRNRFEVSSLDGLDRQRLDHALSGLSRDSGHRENARGEASERLQRALAGLDAEDRTLMEGVYFEELPLKEMSATLGWSLVKTKVRAYRARNKMRTIIQTMFESEGKR